MQPSKRAQPAMVTRLLLLAGRNRGAAQPARTCSSQKTTWRRRSWTILRFPARATLAPVRQEREAAVVKKTDSAPERPRRGEKRKRRVQFEREWNIAEPSV